MTTKRERLKAEDREFYQWLRNRSKAHRNRMEPIAEAKLAKLVVSGRADATPLGEYGWRIVSGDMTIDFWPRTGRWRTPRGEMDGRGWRSLLTALFGAAEPILGGTND